jgi:hypothetical protein
VEHKAGMTIEPGLRLGILMRSVIVEDKMNDPADRDLGLHRVQKSDEFLVPVALHAAPNPPSSTSRAAKQGCGAVSFIVMRQVPRKDPHIRELLRLDSGSSIALSSHPGHRSFVAPSVYSAIWRSAVNCRSDQPRLSNRDSASGFAVCRPITCR